MMSLKEVVDVFVPAGRIEPKPILTCYREITLYFSQNEMPQRKSVRTWRHAGEECQITPGVLGSSLQPGTYRAGVQIYGKSQVFSFATI